jgi:drug/metabolite transporter (DMT)-like permease
LKRAYAYTLLVVISWGISLPTTKALLMAVRGEHRLTPLQVAFWSVAVGWLALLVVLAIRRRLGALSDVSSRGWAVLVAMGFFGWAGYLVALNVAFVRLPLPDAIVINYLHPVFVVLFQGALFGSAVGRFVRWEHAAPRRRVRAWQIGSGLGLCLLGVATIATEGKLSELGALRSSVGAAAALFAALSWGVYSNLGRFVAVRGGRSSALTGDVQTWVAMTFGLAMLLAALAVGSGPASPSGYVASVYLGSSLPHHVSAWVLIGILGVVVYCGGYTLWLVALALGRQARGDHKLPPLTYMTPVLAVALGWIFLHESPGAGFWWGAALIALGNLAIAVDWLPTRKDHRSCCSN